VTSRFVSRTTNADFELRTFNGTLESHPARDHRDIDVGARFPSGQRGAKVRGRTFSGDVRVEAKSETKK
jgi:hypothetical protein